jgi:hypothetical protein
VRPPTQRTARRAQAGAASPHAHDDMGAAKVGFSLVAESWGKTKAGRLGTRDVSVGAAAFSFLPGRCKGP